MTRNKKAEGQDAAFYRAFSSPSVNKLGKPYGAHAALIGELENLLHGLDEFGEEEPHGKECSSNFSASSGHCDCWRSKLKAILHPKVKE